MKSRFKKNVEDTDMNDFMTAVEEETGQKKWYHELDDDPKSFEHCSEQVLMEVKDEAKRCYDSEVTHFNIKSSKTNKNYQWIKTVMSKGTLSDKIASYVVAIQDEPLCSLDIIKNMVNMVKVGKKKECTLIVDTLTELFLSDLLIPDKKLKAFHQRPLSLLNDLSSGNAVSRRKLLSLWYFEDQLKELYMTFITAMNTIAHDTIDKSKEQSVGAMFKLLSGNPEQEKNLLSNLVNKLGDPSQKVASKTIYCLSQLLFKHPNMQEVVLKEVEKLLFRPNVSSKAQYYALCFLSQYYLSHDSSHVAQALIDVYFSFFKACIKKGEVDSRMMSALLMGVNRAYPYAKMDSDKITEHIDTIYRVVHIANFNIGLHALTLLYQVADFGNTVTDRFFAALYKKLFDPDLLTTTHQAMFLSLVYRALQKDKEVTRVKVFVKRLLQVSLYVQPSFACGMLYLVSQLMGKREGVQSLVWKQSTLVDGDDDEETYHDVKDKTEDEEKPDVDTLNEKLAEPSWYHRDNSKKPKDSFKNYQPLSRNPLYAGGNVCAYTELILLKNHFHPTVSLYATNLLWGEVIKYSGDPLKDFTLIRFLDRFVFKNPKKTDQDAVKGAHPTFGIRKLYKPKGVRSLPVDSVNYLNEHIANIPVDEVFMYRYLHQKKEQKEQDSDADSDLESVQSEEFEEMLEKMSGLPKDDELDFMNEIGNSLRNKSKRKHEENDEDDDDDDEVDDEPMGSDEDDLGMEEGDEDLLDDDDDEDEDMVFDSDSDAETNNVKASKSNMKRNKKGKDSTALFASAEEFASLLEDEGSSKIAPGGSNAFANKDNAPLKQLAWEEKRSNWLRGYDNAMGKAKKGKHSFQKEHNENRRKWKKGKISK